MLRKNQERRSADTQPAAAAPAGGVGNAHLGVRQAEDAGIVGTPHHDFVLLTRRMAAGTLRACSLGAVALPSHPVAGGVSHGCSSSPGPPAVGNNTGLGTPRRPRQGRPWLRPCAWGFGQGNPRPREAEPGDPSSPSLQGRPEPPPPPTPNPLDACCSGNPLWGTPRIPARTAQARPHPNHLPRCSPSSPSHQCDGCSADKATNKVIEIETAPRASKPDFLLKWLQGQWREARPARSLRPRGDGTGSSPASLAASASVVGSLLRQAGAPAPQLASRRGWDVRSGALDQESLSRSAPWPSFMGVVSR